MWSIVIAIMLSTGTTEPKVPILVASFSNLTKCRLELVEISKIDGYELVVSPLLSYSVAKEEEGKTTMAFCINNIESI